MPLVVSREHSPLAVLLDPKTDIPLGERDIRVEDWLNDKMQSGADLDSQNLDTLLESVEFQKKLLEEQLENAKIQLAEAKKDSETRTSNILDLALKFNEDQASVDARLMMVTSSRTPDEAAQRLKRPLEKLRKLELAERYVELLNEVETLVNEACGYLPADPKEALKPYIRLKEMALMLQKLQEPAEGAATHLVAYVQEASSRLWLDMKSILVVEFEAILKQGNWPESAEPPSREWSDSFEKLLDLQGPEIMAAREPIILLPMSVVAKPFVQQFRYHFFSNVPTNHPHKLGEYFFPWFLGTLGKWQDFFRDNLGPILAAHFRGTLFAGNSLYVDPLAAFITAMLPVLKEKIDSLALEISSEPQFLSRFIKDLLEFDSDIRDKFDYDAGNSEYGWKGLAWDFLTTWFDRWLEIEKDFAMARYQDIVKVTNSPIDYDSAGPGKTKPTFEATSVTELISTVTDQYSKLRRFSYKAKFLINIQAEILDQYLERLTSALSFYQSANTAVGRTLHGVTKEELAKLEGMGGLETLCRVFGSADHFISKLQDWTNEPFFVELWDQMQDRAKVSSAEDVVTGGMTYNEVKEATSDSLGTKDEGSVFDVTIRDYKRQRDRAEDMLTQAVKYSFPTTFRQYITKSSWTTVGDASSSNLPMAITAELDQPLQILKKYLEFLHRTLAEPVFRRITRESLHSLQLLLFQDILLKQDFTAFGAARFRNDIQAIQSVVNSVTSSASLTMPKLHDGVELLNIPVDGGEGQESPLKKACLDLLTGDSAQADKLLERMGVTHLSYFEARSVLARRMEASFDMEDDDAW